jgi:hypothetical protein
MSYFKSLDAMETQLPKMIDLFRQDFNSILQKVPNLGNDSQGIVIAPVAESWILEVEGLFDLLDEEKRGCLDSDRMQFFLIALLLNEIKDENKDDMLILI